MGDFTSEADMKTTYQESDLVRLTRPDGSTEITIDSTVLDHYIEQAEAVVKGYIQSKYALPFVSVPVVIKKIARFLSYYFLRERKFTLNDQLVQIYDSTMQQLKDLQNGKMVLDSLPGINPFQDADVQNAIAENDSISDTSYLEDLENFI